MPNIAAFVLMPDHLHCIWSLPPDDKEYPMRWNLIKSHFTRYCPGPCKAPRSSARQRKREQTVWQRRYREHKLRDDRGFENYCDDIHGNPVKHGSVPRTGDWPYSSFHRFVRLGIYPPDWAGHPEHDPDGMFGE